MAYDEALAERVRDLLADAALLTEKKMFGGIGWMIGGHMACGVASSGGLIVRCSREDFDPLRSRPGADAMKRGDTPMTGWLIVDGDTVIDDAALAWWVGVGRAHASGMPPK
ncbi:MAG: TfoX/Sxy family protein [Alphaproteobacteria bacterium]|nr:TfoX/Sxy family protein [Alphaproteobacteria bacterium]